MGVNEVKLGNETLINLKGDTVTPSTLMEGETAHNRAGEPIVGTAINVDDLSDSTATPIDADIIVTRLNAFFNFFSIRIPLNKPFFAMLFSPSRPQPPICSSAISR